MKKATKLEDKIQRAKRWISQFEVHGIKKGLENIALLLKQINYSRGKTRVIHVAGTNGKGSVCAMLSAILKQAGYRVGCYLSPHLIDLRERCLIHHKKVTPLLFIKGVNEVKTAYHEILRDHPEFKPTYFEITTAIFFWIFMRSKLQWLIIETGLGGRWDSTNVIDSEVQMITNIGLDHTQYLGKTIRKIAAEKAGIIKPSSYVISGARGPALEVVKKVCKNKKSRLYYSAKDFRTKIHHYDLKSQIMDVHLRDHHYDRLELALLGKHQAANCAMALCAIQLLKKDGLDIPDRDVRKVLQNIRWPGRFHVVSRSPVMIVDGAHNADGISALCKNLIDYICKSKIHIIFSAFLDKDIDPMVRLLSSISDRVTLVRMKSKRSQDPYYIKKVWLRYHPFSKITIAPNVRNILKNIKKQERRDTVYVVCGSLYLVGEILNELGIKPFH